MLGWPFPMLKYKYIFKNQFIVLFIVIFHTLSFPMVMDIFIGCINSLKQSVVLLITLRDFLL